MKNFDCFAVFLISNKKHINMFHNKLIVFSINILFYINICFGIVIVSSLNVRPGPYICGHRPLDESLGQQQPQSGPHPCASKKPGRSDFLR